jgi:RHS repeat-associated protein
MTTRQFSRFLVLSSLFAHFAPITAAQSNGYQTNVGITSYGSYISSNIDTVDLAHGGLKIQIPVVTRKGRAFEIATTLRYDSKIWVAIAYDFDYQYPGDTHERFWWSPTGDPLPAVTTTPGGGYIDHNEQLYTCSQDDPQLPPPQAMIYSNWRYIEADGTAHNFPTRRVQNTIPGLPPCDDDIQFTPQLLKAPSDTGGMKIDISAYDAYGTRILKAWFKDGTVWNSPGSLSLTDTNGNQCCAFQNNWLLDSIGRPVEQTRPGSNPFTDPTYIDFYDSTGQVRTVRLQPANPPVATAFPSVGPAYPGNCGFEQYNGGHLGWQSITLPNGLAYTFFYDDPNNPGHPNPFGEITKITLPTGGYIKYKWATLSQWDNGPVTGLCAGTPLDSRVLIERRVSPDGVTEQVWTYAYSSGGPGTTTVTDPVGNIEVHSFANLGPNWWSDVLVENQVEYRNSSGTALRRVTTDWATDTGPSIAFQTLDDNNAPGEPTGFFLGNSQPRNPRIIRVTTTLLDSNQVSKVETDYGDCLIWTAYNSQNFTDCPNNPTQIREYDYGSGSAGAMLRYTNLTYLHGSSGPYFDAHMMDRVTGKYVYAGSGTLAAQTTYGYDSTTVANTSNAPAPYHDYTNFSSGNTLRGNQTTVSRWLNTTGGSLTTTNYFNDVGNLVKTSDPLGNSTQFSYADNFSDGTNRNSQAYVTAITHPTTNGVSHVEGKQYFWYTGLNAATCGQNYPSPTTCSNALNPTQSSPVADYAKYTYDFLGRAATLTQGDGGVSNYCFSDIAGSLCASSTLLATSRSPIDSTKNIVSTSLIDGLGRLKQTQLNSDPCGADFVDITYDPLGNKSTVSNPYRLTDPCATGTATNGTVTSQYDALGRVTKIIPADGSASVDNISTIYYGNCATVADEANKARKSCSDGLGRLTQVFEDPSGSNYETDYTYDTLDNLKQVVQNGSHQRSFLYDSLSRLVSATNPESGTICYGTISGGTCQQNGYDGNGNMVTKTDARGIKITYSYDALNRLTRMSYSDGEPAVSYSYDQSTCLGQSTCFNIGRRTGMSETSGSEAWAYDAMGRSISDKRTTNGVTRTTTYTYNFNGSVFKATYPNGTVVTYVYDAAGQPISAMDQNNVVFATSAAYTPQGALASLQNGANIISTYYYNQRLQPCRISVKTSGSIPSSCSDVTHIGNVLDYSYNFSVGTSNNGNVAGITNNRDATRSQVFSYDQLNRLSSGQTLSTTGTNCWDESYGFDSWGNLLSIGRVPGTWSCTNLESLSVTMNASNQNSLDTYDLAGNLTVIPGTGGASYSYNAENQLISTGGVNYTYDGDGKRVQKSNGTLYWYGMGSDPLVETNASGAMTNEYVYFGGRRIARRDSSGNIYYYFSDHLGSSRVILQAGQTTPCYDSDFYPFGGERIVTNTCAQNYKFTGKERDSESNLDNFGARYDSSNTGRFMSPDPLFFQASMQIDPQRFNLYAYARNNPLKWTDPSGERLFLKGDTAYLVSAVLYGLSGGSDGFGNIFHIFNNEVLLNDNVDPNKISDGIKLIYDLVVSSDIYVWYAGTSGSDAVDLFLPDGGKPYKDSKGKLTASGKALANEFDNEGYIEGLSLRRGVPIPANLNGEPVYSVIAFNTGMENVEERPNYGALNPVPADVKSAEEQGVGGVVAPVSLFIHESAEALSFRSSGDFSFPEGYFAAHDAAIVRETEIRNELHIGGGFAGSALVPRNPKKH